MLAREPIDAIDGMRPDIRAEIASRLQRDYNFKATQGDWFQQGVCPSCGKRELYASAANPWVLRCGRLNKCGWESATKELYPDAFERINERFPASTEDPNATVEAYLSFCRGLPLSPIKGCYRQGYFHHPHANRSTATVVFDVAPGVTMERFVEPVLISDPEKPDQEPMLRKQNFRGSYKGLVWHPVGMTLEPGEALWLVEGCLDALSLWVNGVKAVAILSAGNFPETYLKGVSGLDLHLVWALDNDPAGNGFTKKHAAAARRLGFSSRAAIIPQKEGVKTDWNDSHQAGLLKTEDREGNPIRFLERCRFHGDLLLAESPKDKGVIIWKRKKSTSFAIDHNYQTYWWELDPTEYTRVFNAYADNGLAPPEGMTLEEMAVQDACKCWNIANCSFRFLYYQYDHLTDEAFYYCLVRFPSGKNTKKGTFTGSQVAAASEFKKRLLSVSAGGLWKGTGSQLDWIINHHLTDIRTVETLQFIGYSRDHQAYIFGDLAVKDGRVYQKNDEDFFELGSAIHKISIKSLNKSVGLKIGNRATYSTGWVDLVYRAFGPRGIVAAAYWFMSLFAEQIRDRWESWPFLEIVGEAGAGKSTLIEFLWRLVGRSAFEGLDPNKSTDAAIARSLTQVSNLPVVLLESDREGQDAKVKSFDWDALKTLFNGRPYRSRGVKNSGTDTDDSPFRGAMVISQNNPVTGSDAIMSRIVHLFFTTAHHSDAGKAAADALAVTKTETVSHFVTMATVQEKDILERFGPSFRHHEAAIAKDPALRLRRIAKCHGQMAAALDCFASLVALPEAIRQDAQAMIYQAARERQASLITEHAVIGQFWDYIEVIGFDVVNHANDGSIALNLAQIDQLFHHRGFRMPCERADLLRHLKEGKRYRYLEQKPISSKHADYYGKTMRCWRFERPRA